MTADGEVRTANRDENPDLFWALRGGGGNFGVVTRFTFRLHEVGPTVTGGLMAWSAERADEVLATYRALTDSAPRELTAALIVMLAPPAPFVPEAWHGKPIVAMLMCHSGRDAMSDLAAVHALGEPIVDLVSEKPYAAQQSMLGDTEPKGLNQYWKTEFLPGLTSEFLETFRDRALKVTSPMSRSVIFHIGGALNDRDYDDGAVGNRDARFVTGSPGCGRPAPPATSTSRGFARGGRVSGPSRPEGTTSTSSSPRTTPLGPRMPTGRTTSGSGASRAEYDPDNLFRVNRNIPPAA